VRGFPGKKTKATGGGGGGGKGEVGDDDLRKQTGVPRKGEKGLLQDRGGNRRPLKKKLKRAARGRFLKRRQQKKKPHGPGRSPKGRGGGGKKVPFSLMETGKKKQIREKKRGQKLGPFGERGKRKSPLRKFQK